MGTVKFDEFYEKALNEWNINDAPQAQQYQEIADMILNQSENEWKESDLGKLFSFLENLKEQSLNWETYMVEQIWKAMAGIVQHGENKGKPMKLNQVQTNSLCVLTTRDPRSKEEDRYIFAVFLVDDSYEGDGRDEGYVSTTSEYKIKLTPTEARSLLFWNYHANDNHPEVAVWSSGLHRYFQDEQAVQILRDIAIIKRGTDEEVLSERFF